MKTSLFIATAACAIAFAAPAHAAVVSWGAATGIAGDADVSTNGTLVGAFNIGAAGVASTTVNGVLFAGLVMAGNNITSGDFNLATAGGFGASNDLGSGAAPFSSLSASYQALLATGATSFTNGFTLTMSDLTIGDEYEFQWWSNASNGALSVLTTATAGNSVTLFTSPVSSNGEVGQYAIGSFVADGAVQTITFTAPVQDILTAFQLRNTTSQVPEPTTLALAGLALLGLCASRRRQSRAGQGTAVEV